MLKSEQGMAKTMLKAENFSWLQFSTNRFCLIASVSTGQKCLKNLFCYDIRHDDECRGDMVELKDYVMVNHWGTVICKEPFGTQEYDGTTFTTKEGLIIGDGDYNYISEDITISEYLDRYDELVAKHCSISDISDEDEFEM